MQFIRILMDIWSSHPAHRHCVRQSIQSFPPGWKVMVMSASRDVSFHHQDGAPLLAPHLPTVPPPSPSHLPAGGDAVFDIYSRRGAAPSLTHSLFALCFIERDESVFPFHRPAADQPGQVDDSVTTVTHPAAAAATAQVVDVAVAQG